MAPFQYLPLICYAAMRLRLQHFDKEQPHPSAAKKSLVMKTIRIGHHLGKTLPFGVIRVSTESSITRPRNLGLWAYPHW